MKGYQWRAWRGPDTDSVAAGEGCVRRRSRREIRHHDLSGQPCSQDLRALRTRTQASPAATVYVAATVVEVVTVIVPNRYFSFGDKHLFLPGVQGNGGAESTEYRGVTLPPDERQNPDELKPFQLIVPCSLTLICSSWIQRLTLAAAFAAAFFMGGIPVNDDLSFSYNKFPQVL